MEAVLQQEQASKLRRLHKTLAIGQVAQVVVAVVVVVAMVRLHVAQVGEDEPVDERWECAVVAAVVAGEDGNVDEDVDDGEVVVVAAAVVVVVVALWASEGGVAYACESATLASAWRLAAAGDASEIATWPFPDDVASLEEEVHVVAASVAATTCHGAVGTRRSAVDTASSHRTLRH
jgi:hypothetical protein